MDVIFFVCYGEEDVSGEGGEEGPESRVETKHDFAFRNGASTEHADGALETVPDSLCWERDGKGFHTSLEPVENPLMKRVVDGMVDRGEVRRGR
jgi:hypothetical protein